jgi:undecaprenyl-diphosphatase
MTIFQAIFLGIIQGITEFLPISSSGHLVIVPHLLGWDFPVEQIFPFDVLIQISTLIAVIAYYWNDLTQIGTAMVKGLLTKSPFGEIEARTGWLAILATIPAGVIGLLFKDQIETVFSRPDIASMLLIVTAIFLFFSEKIGKMNRKIIDLNWLDAVAMGFSQACAIFPGISRSGSTISGGLARNLDRKSAGQFTFLMAIPIMAAAGLLSLFDLFNIPDLAQFLPVMIAGFVTSGLVGFFSIRWLLKYIANHSLIPFAIYCAILGSGSLLLSANRLDILSKNEVYISQDVYHISHSTSVEWIKPKISECMQKYPESVFILNQTNDPALYQDSDIHFSYDELTSQLDHSYLLGNDAFTIGVNPNSMITQLSSDALKDIYQGKITLMSELQGKCGECVIIKDGLDSDSSFKLWGYPQNSFLEETIQKTFLLDFFSPEMFVAPNATLMKQAVLLEDTAIGIFPQASMTAELNEIPVIDFSTDQSFLPIIASSTYQPDPFLEGFIACVQTKINQ